MSKIQIFDKQQLNDLNRILSESIEFTTDRLIKHNLQKQSKITIEECQFLRNLATEVILEASEDFIPDEEEITDDGEVSLNDRVLSDQNGKEFIYRELTGTLDPVDSKNEDQSLQIKDMINAMAPEIQAEQPQEPEMDPQMMAMMAQQQGQQEPQQPEMDPQMMAMMAQQQGQQEPQQEPEMDPQMMAMMAQQQGQQEPQQEPEMDPQMMAQQPEEQQPEQEPQHHHHKKKLHENTIIASTLLNF